MYLYSSSVNSIWFCYYIHTPPPPLFPLEFSTIFQPLTYNPNFLFPFSLFFTPPFFSLSPVSKLNPFIRVSSIIHVTSSKFTFVCAIVELKNDWWKQIFSLLKERCVKFFYLLYVSFYFKLLYFFVKICGPHNVLLNVNDAFHTFDYG